MSEQEPNTQVEPAPKKPRKPRKKLKDMTPEELAERQARKAERDKAWLREHRPHMALMAALFCFAIAGVTGAGSSDVGGTVQTQCAEVLLIFSAIPMLILGVDGAVILFLALGAIALVVAAILWVQLWLEKRRKKNR